MRSLLTLPFVIGITLAVADYDAARAIPANPRPLSAVAAASDIQLVRGRGGRAVAVRGPRGGAAVRGPRGGVAVRGAYGGAAVRGPRGGVAARHLVRQCAAVLAGPLVGIWRRLMLAVD
jgi:hypothetical protein